MEMMSKGVIDSEVVFENCKFHRATALSKDKESKLNVTIQPGTGRFEVSERDLALVTGKVFVPDKLTVAKLDTNRNNDVTLNTKDVYKELRLRGYNYR